MAGSAFQCHCTAEVRLIDADQLKATCQGCGRTWFRNSVSDDHFKPERLHPPDPVNHDLAECERRLKAMPGYSPFTGTPGVFECECGRRFEYQDDESEGASWVQVTTARDPLSIRGLTPTEIVYDEAATWPEKPGVPDDAECSMCGDTGLMLGGWMGPTRAAPWPRPCTSCDSGRAMTPRAVQVKVMELVQTDLESHYFVEKDGELAERVPGWWAANYVPLLGLEDPRFTHGWRAGDAEPFDIGDQDIAKYVTDDDEAVLVTREGIDPPHSEIAHADIWKVLTPNGVAVKKHRYHSSAYFECGDDRSPFGRCTEQRGHVGPHRDDTTGRTWG